MKIMLLKKDLDDLIAYMQGEAKTLGIVEADVKKIEVKTASNIEFCFPSLTNQLELIRRVTRQVASSLKFSEEDLDDIGLAIDEACTNIVCHSYARDHDGIMKVRFELDPMKLAVFLIDEGEKGQLFNPDKLDPLDKEKYLKELTKGGLGVYLIKKIMDEVEYTVSPGVYNCLRMVKYTRI